MMSTFYRTSSIKFYKLCDDIPENCYDIDQESRYCVRVTKVPAFLEATPIGQY